MKKIEVKLSLSVVAPLLDVIKQVADVLSNQHASFNNDADADAELMEVWGDDLLNEQNNEIAMLLGLFDTEFFASGVISFDEENAEPVLRACAAVRLRLRTDHLLNLDDDELESGTAEVDDLEEPIKRAFMCYLFLATIQELIIQHLDSEILGG